MFRRAIHLCAAPVVALGLIAACVGDEPSAGSTAPSDAADGSTTTDGSSSPATPDGSTGTDGGEPADAGPRCDPTKPFNAVERLKGISTADSETGVWVSADELTAYVAVSPASGSGSAIRKSTRASRDVDFGAATTATELAQVNDTSFVVTMPSLSADHLVLVTARDGVGSDDGIYVAQRTATSTPFSAPVRARSRASNVSFGDPFLAAHGEILMLGLDNGVNGFDITGAPRDTGMTYGDGGYVDYAVSPAVANVSDEVANDRRPVISSNLLTLVFASNRSPGSGTNTDLYISERAGPSGTFTSPARLNEPVSSDAADLPGSLSEDGCVLYFTSNRAGGFGEFDVYAARRPR